MAVIASVGGAVGLSGCHNWRLAENEIISSPCEHSSVLTELGLQPSLGSLSEPSVGPDTAFHAPGPSLVAGDAIAWNWAIAFGQAPRSETPAWVYAGFTTD